MTEAMHTRGRGRTATRRYIMAGLVVMLVLVIGMIRALRADTEHGQRQLIVSMGADFGRLALTLDARTERLFIANQTTVDMFDARQGVRLRTVSTIPVQTVVCKTRVCPSIAPSPGVVVRQVPEMAIVDEAVSHVFVTDGDYGHVSMLNGMTGAFLRNVSVGGVPGALAVDERMGHVFVADVEGHKVSMLDASTGRILATSIVGQKPSAVAIDETMSRVFVVNAGDDSVSTLDSRTGRVLGTHIVGWSPQAAAVARRAHHVFVVDHAGNSVTILDSQTGLPLRTVAVGHDPIAIAADERTDHVFIANYGAHTVTILDGISGLILRTVPVDGPPRALLVDGHARDVVVVETHSGDTSGPTGNVEVIDIQSGQLLHALSVGHVPSAAAVDDRAGHTFILNQGCIQGGLMFDPFALATCQGAERPTTSIGDILRRLVGGSPPMSQDTTVSMVDTVRFGGDTRHNSP